MEGSFIAAVEAGLAVQDHDASSHPVWVLLDKDPYSNDDGETCFDGGDNATTAHAVTSGGRTVKVTFRLASAPSVSRFCFHDDTEDHFNPVEVEVMSSAKDLVLFRPSTRRKPNLYEYLVYQAASHRANSLPTLKVIPAIHPSMSYPAILPCPCDDDDDDDREFLIADLSATPDRGRYILDVFSSKTNKCVTWRLQLQSPSVVCTEDSPPHKVMALGGGAVGWIYLWQGLLVCNVLDERPVLRFIPLPKPGIDLRRVADLQMVRDVTCCDGIIKFVEMDCRFKEVCRTPKKANKTFYGDLEGEGIIYDSELLLEESDPSRSVHYAIVPDGWKIRTCYRHISWDYWRKGHVVDSDDIEVDSTRYSKLLPHNNDYNTQRSALKNLGISYPTLSARSDDVVYLWSTTYTTWVVGVDLGKKTVEVVEKINFDFTHPLLSCAFSDM